MREQKTSPVGKARSLSYLLKKIVSPELAKMGFLLVKYQSNNYIFQYCVNKGDYIAFSKPQRENAFCCLLHKEGSVVPYYTIIQAARFVGSDSEKKKLKYASTYFYYDSDEELLGALEYVYSVIMRIYKDFFEGNLERLLFEKFKEDVEKEKQKKAEVGESSYSAMALEEAKLWKSVRFPCEKW